MADENTTASRRGIPRGFRRPAVGDRYGRVTVIAESEDRFRSGKAVRYVWAQCWCERGTVFETSLHDLRSGHTTSCGGHRPPPASKTHGMVGTPTYRAWLAIQDRCKGVAKETYARNYRDRGITVCEGWSGPGGFERFLADMGERPHPKLTIERVDNDKGYSPDNCRWATRAEQSRNTRQNVWITMPDGERVVLEDACDVAGIKSCTVSGTASRTGGTRQDMFDFYAGAPSASYGFQLVLYAQAWLASRPWPRGFMALL